MSSEVLSYITEAASDLQIKPTTLCAKAVGNGHLPNRLQGGGSVTLATVERIRSFVEDAKARRRQDATT